MRARLGGSLLRLTQSMPLLLIAASTIAILYFSYYFHLLLPLMLGTKRRRHPADFPAVCLVLLSHLLSLVAMSGAGHRPVS